MRRAVKSLVRTLSMAVGLAGVVALAAALTKARGQDLAGLLRLPEGFRVSMHANNLPRPRLMALTETGDILVTSMTGQSVLRVRADADGDGRSDGTDLLLGDLARPHGLLLDGGFLYVAEEARMFRVRYDHDTGTVSGGPETVLGGLPAGPGHWTRTLKRGPDGALYVSVGSGCNACVEEDPRRATLLRLEPGGEAEIFARGLRNMVGFDWQPGTGALYGVDNGRDGLGDDVPPDELNRIVEGGFYGFPFLHGDNVPDPGFAGVKLPEAIEPLPPAHSFAAHVAPLAIRFLRHQRAPGYAGVALVSQHGSWNRSARIGYRVVSLHWGKDGAITERPFLDGFLLPGDAVFGRPVDIVEAPDGTLFISDDAGGAIWRVTWQGGQKSAD